MSEKVSISQSELDRLGERIDHLERLLKQDRHMIKGLERAIVVMTDTGPERLASHWHQKQAPIPASTPCISLEWTPDNIQDMADAYGLELSEAKILEFLEFNAESIQEKLDKLGSDQIIALLRIYQEGE